MKVLVAVDKSEASQVALQYTCHLLEHFDAKVVDALYVKPDEADLGPETLYMPFVAKDQVKAWIEAEADAVGEQVLSSCNVCETGKVPCWPRIATGEPADEILHIANSEGYDMIVLGAHGRSSLRGFVLGTVHAKILHHACQPVLIVRNYRPINRVLVAYRGSECDQGALEFIAGLLAKKKPQITVMHVQENVRAESDGVAKSCLYKGEQTLRKLDHVPVAKSTKGDFVDEILKEVATERYDLIVLGAYSHQPPKHLKLISDEALNIARLTTRPILVYRDKTTP
ncbi:MAG: universal stress protein [Deltaproteobacteria bacterium]|nr:universal stress protein [Deltaproteobacteria bacterium]